MTVKPIPFKDAGIPQIRLPKSASGKTCSDVTLFDLSSHHRAREAMDFALKTRHLQFHVFMVGEDRSGRMTATLAFLNQHVKNLPVPDDWVYLNNFLHSHRPKPFHLPAGKGYEMKEHLRELVESIQSILSKTFSHPDFVTQIDAMSASLEERIQHQIDKLRDLAHTKGVEIEQGPQGFLIHSQEENNDKGTHTRGMNEIRERLSRITTAAHLASRQLILDMKHVKITVADHAITPLIEDFSGQYGQYLDDWIVEFKQDTLDNIDEILNEDLESEIPGRWLLSERYAVNLLIDNRNVEHPKVLLEPNPTYENLFGSIKYRAAATGGVETNFTMIRPGALHLANGGILVLRADALAKDPISWDMLKAALRDGHIRMEEIQREHMLPLMDAPAPKSIPLNLQVFLIGSPVWFYSFFYLDPDFKTFFKVKADIDPDLPVTPQNLQTFAKLLDQAAYTHTHMTVNNEAKAYLIAYSARWVEHRKKMTARFELIADVLDEASIIAKDAERQEIRCVDIHQALAERRQRNARLEDRTHEGIVEGLVGIQTRGKCAGQINALVVYGNTDHYFGCPCRVTARTYVGEFGVINIERLTDMAGPLQQKGTLILDGLLNGFFAQDFPVSFNCSLTFEQNYMEVEGDSASMAELIAILSALSGIPIRQDVAVTGSVDQFGNSQAVGGISHKIEGFFRVCKNQGFTGTQGVIIPYSNKEHVVLHDDVVEAMKEEKFFIWPAKHMDEVVELMMGAPKQVYADVYKKLAAYDQLIKSRRR